MKFAYNTFDFTAKSDESFQERLQKLKFENGIHTVGIHDHPLKIPAHMDKLLCELSKTHMKIEILNTNAQIQDYHTLMIITFKTTGPKQ